MAVDQCADTYIRLMSGCSLLRSVRLQTLRTGQPMLALQIHRSPGISQASTTADAKSPWHTDLMLYLWFPGVHGITGVNGFNVGYKASATDLLSHYRFGLIGSINAERGRFTILTEAMWVRLRGDKRRPSQLNGVSTTCNKVTSNTTLVPNKTPGNIHKNLTRSGTEQHCSMLANAAIGAASSVCHAAKHASGFLFMHLTASYHSGLWIRVNCGPDRCRPEPFRSALIRPLQNQA